MVKLKTLRESAIELMSQSDIKEARADTDFLLFFLLGADKKDILLGEKLVDKKQEENFLNAVKRRIEGEPVQYITGETEFMSLRFFVDKSTLIPRADTEILVEKCLEYAEKYNIETVLDIGTGSGCIGESLCVYNKNIKASLMDISKDALKMAEKNAKSLGVEDSVELLNADVLKMEELKGQFDLVVSNPPYIETHVVKTLEEKVTDYEPVSALDGGEDGLLFYRKITHLAAEKCRFIAFEIGYNQKDTVREIMEEYFYEIELFSDYGKNPRVLIGKNKQI